MGVAFLSVFALGTVHDVWARTPTPTPSARIPLKKLMTVDAYDQAGLDRLTEAQRWALEVWLAHHLKKMSSTLQMTREMRGSRVRQRTRPSAVSRFGLPRHSRPAISGDKMESHIKGMFGGWTGSTRFHLTNGETWAQAGPGYFRIPAVLNPRVEIKKLPLGYVFRVRGYGEQVFVTRVR